jgi:hypothetical protein
MILIHQRLMVATAVLQRRIINIHKKYVLPYPLEKFLIMSQAHITTTQDISSHLEYSTGKRWNNYSKSS